MVIYRYHILNCIHEQETIHSQSSIFIYSNISDAAMFLLQPQKAYFCVHVLYLFQTLQPVARFPLLILAPET